MTKNIAESFNKVLKGIRSLPFCAIIELTFYRTADYFRDYGNQAKGCTTRFAPRVQMLLDDRRGRRSTTVLGPSIGTITSSRFCATASILQGIAPETLCNSVM